MAELHSSVGSGGLENRRSLVQFLTRPTFFPRIDNNHCDRIHSSLTAVHCFDDGYVGKQPVVWNEYCAECWLKELQKSMDRSTCRHNTVENGVKHNTINRSINQPILSNNRLYHEVEWRMQKI